MHGGPMRVYISVDMEGIAGVSHPKPTSRVDTEYPAAVELMIGEANAAIEGSVAAGATDILVNDSHGGMYNLRPAALHPAARLLQGQKAWSMVAGAQRRDGKPAFDVAMFVGYHARAGHPTGTIAHTYNSAPVETRLNGRPTGEYGFNALVLGVWGIAVGLVAGDDALADEAAGWLPWSERVVVKEGFGSSAAASLHPDRAVERIRDAASRAVERARAGELRLLEVDEPVTIEVDYRRGIEADFAALVPGGERVGDRTARHVGPDAISAYRGFLAGVRLATIIE
ncbi:MAG TPA: M55 family metallopeptidase [Candidatus Limnocylindrales bacterium]|nr:M55 family metallopeptidase [Candidatus Limnocylindrales bacterium]